MIGKGWMMLMNCPVGRTLHLAAGGGHQRRQANATSAVATLWSREQFNVPIAAFEASRRRSPERRQR